MKEESSRAGLPGSKHGAGAVVWGVWGVEGSSKNG